MTETTTKVSNNSAQKQVSINKNLPTGWKIFLAVIVATYIYLIIPVKISWNIMGIQASITMHYQPLTTCLHGKIITSILGGLERDMKRCGVSPIEFLKIKHNKSEIQSLPYSIYEN